MAADHLKEYCAPEIADNVLKLARNSTSLDSFLASCLLFVRAPREVLEKVWGECGGNPSANNAHDELENKLVEPSETQPLGKENSSLTSPSSPSSSSLELDRQWYQDTIELPLPEEHHKYTKRNPDSKLHIYYQKRNPPFIKTSLELPALCQINKLPTGNLAQRAKQGSEVVRDFMVNRERKRAVHSKTDARGTLKSLQASTAISHKKPSQLEETTTLTFSELQQVRKTLPSFKVKDQLMETIRENQVTIVVGETGSGKTTQLPQFLIENGYASFGMIGCTQPRRVAAMSVAERVAAERGVVLGSQVGYSIRFEQKLSPETKIKFLTDGILLREALNDQTLDQYSCIIIDEAHERALNTDILLGLFKRILAQRHDLKLIVTSATINASLFSDFFGRAPIFNIPGRTFPVKINNIKSPIADYVQAAATQALSIHLQGHTGDILVFMTGQDDIEACCSNMREKLDSLDHPPELEILPIYSQLPADLQSKIFLPSPHRKVIVATNIAETSLTVPGIKYVIDSGYTKCKVYQPRYGIDTLQLVPISKANASQRAGRAGRTSEGFAYRMYTKNAEVDEMYDQPIPEIQRTNLSNTLLLLKSLGVNDINSFDFLDPPDDPSIQASLRDIWIIGAIDSSGQLSEMGHRLSQFPLDPFLGRMVLASIDNGCSVEMLTIVAMISAPPVFIRSNQRAKECDAAHERFQVPESDHLTLLNIYNEWRRNGESSKWCQENYFQTKTLRYAKSIRAQLERVCGSSSLKSTSDHDLIRKCVCMAYFHQASHAKGLQSFVGISSGVEMHLHPTSSLYGLGHIPEYVVYHQVMLTSKQYMTTVTAVEPEWLLDYGSIMYSTESSIIKETEEEVQAPAASKPKFKRRKEGKPAAVNKRFMRGV